VAERPSAGRVPDARWERLPLAGLIDVQGAAAAVAAFAQVLQTDLPAIANQVRRGAGVDVFWLAPSHWLVRVPLSREAGTAAALAAAAAAHPAAVTVVSDACAGFRLSGTGASELPAQGCPLDLRTLTAGTCARSLLARAQVLIVPLRDGPGYELFVESSHARYAELWLGTALRG